MRILGVGSCHYSYIRSLNYKKMRNRSWKYKDFRGKMFINRSINTHYHIIGSSTKVYLLSNHNEPLTISQKSRFVSKPHPSYSRSLSFKTNFTSFVRLLSYSKPLNILNVCCCSGLIPRNVNERWNEKSTIVVAAYCNGTWCGTVYNN